MILTKTITKNTKFIIFALSVSFAFNSFGCDDILKMDSNNNIKRECAIQDRYRKVKAIFNNYNLDINEVSEYRAIRFIDRYSWNKNIYAGNPFPRWIYKPMPTTWDVWNNGIKLLFENKKNYPENLLNLNYISYMNKVLLTDGKTSIKDLNTADLKPGKIRKTIFGPDVGFCSKANKHSTNKLLRSIKTASQSYMKSWEVKAGITIKKLVKEYKGKSSRKADLVTGMILRSNTCKSGKGNFLYYVSSNKVKRKLNWLNIFLHYNLDKYSQGKVIIPPIELAAIIQKIFVSIHPFADGNGRTSRALQNMILEKMDMPFAPAGDLQNDVLEKPIIYVDNTYLKTESMLTFLESCADNLINENVQDVRCKPYYQLVK